MRKNKCKKRHIRDFVWDATRGLCRSASSDWQANSIGRGAAFAIALASALVFAVMTTHSAFLFFARSANTAAVFEMIVGCVSGALMLIAGGAYLHLYFVAYELKEEPVVTDGPPDSHGQWESLFPPESQIAPSDGEKLAPSGGGKSDSNSDCVDERAVERYVEEFFFNALVNPRSVFVRVSEHVRPGRKMLDCTIDYEVGPPRARGMRMAGVNDLSARDHPKSCFLPVPLSFQKRGELSIKLVVANSSGTKLPTTKLREVVEYIVSMMERHKFKKGKLEDSPVWQNGLRDEVIAYLKNREPNESLEVPESVLEAMRGLSGDAWDNGFAERACYMLAGMKDVVPVCISLHVAAVPAEEGPDAGAARGGDRAFQGEGSSSPDAASFPSFSSRVFTIRLEQKIETAAKPANVFPNLSRSPFGRLANEVVGRLGRRNDTVYYNLARAGRSTSYHLYLEGPEGTYYARGSILKEDPRDTRAIHADYVEMQKRYGQRHAHIYISNGHIMSNAAFMFRYKQTPLDTYHIMFVAAFLCLAVLVVSAMTSIGAGVVQPGVVANEGNVGGGDNLSVPTMILAVATAAGPWIYNRTSEGRGDSLGVEVAALALTLCSATGILLFFMSAQGGGAGNGAVVWLWSVVVAVMAVNASFVGFVSLLHSSLYRHLAGKPLDDDADRERAPRGPRAVEMEGGVRLDTPHGRAAMVCGLVMALVSIVLSFNGPRKERAEERECAIRIREIENKAQLDRAHLDAKAVLSAAVGCGNDGGADAGKKKKRKKRTSARRRRAR